MRLFDVITAGKEAAPDSAAIVDAGGVTSWSALDALAREYRTQFAELATQRVGIEIEKSASTMALLAALDRLGCHVFLLGKDGEPRSAEEIQKLSSQLNLAAVLQWLGNGWAQSTTGNFLTDSENLVTILTSGTEGKPKQVTHTWQSLSKPVRETLPQSWLLTYRLELYAGLQVALQAILNHGTLVMPATNDEPTRVAEMMLDHEVRYASATPSYWRRMLLFADRELLSQIALRQITLGGEIADQQILDSLASAFPSARIVHIYATSELGRCFSVADGKAGFPTSLLDDQNGGEALLKIEDGQLHVNSRNRMRGYGNAALADDWFATGDLVEISGDRVIFLGRNGDIINVGGNKVRPVQVERMIRQLSGIRDVRVYGLSSSVAGQIVCCDVVADEAQFDASDSIVPKIAAYCREHCRPHEIPRMINLVDAIAMTSAGKIRRTQ